MSRFGFSKASLCGRSLIDKNAEGLYDKVNDTHIIGFFKGTFWPSNLPI